MSECFDIGIGGGCGLSCAVFRRAECYEHQDDMLRDLLYGEGYDETINILGGESETILDYFTNNREIIRNYKMKTRLSKLNRIEKYEES